MLMVVSFSFAFYLLLYPGDENNPQFEHYWGCLLETYMLLLGQQQGDFSKTRSAQLLYLIFTFLVNLTLLNLLITIIGSALKTVEEKMGLEGPKLIITLKRITRITLITQNPNT